MEKTQNYKRGFTRICKNCNKPFDAPTNKQNYCGCKRKPPKSPKPTLTINCFICSKPFTSKSPNHKYCSDPCREIAAERVINKLHKESSFKIFERDDFTCIYCGKSSIKHGAVLHVDHVYPVSSGGDNELYNLVTSCQECNLSKSVTPLSNENTLLIWTRNRQLNINFKEDYQSLKQMFDKYFHFRADKFK